MASCRRRKACRGSGRSLARKRCGCSYKNRTTALPLHPRYLEANSDNRPAPSSVSTRKHWRLSPTTLSSDVAPEEGGKRATTIGSRFQRFRVENRPNSSGSNGEGSVARRASRTGSAADVVGALFCPKCTSSTSLGDRGVDHLYNRRARWMTRRSVLLSATSPPPKETRHDPSSMHCISSLVTNAV